MSDDRKNLNTGSDQGIDQNRDRTQMDRDQTGNSSRQDISDENPQDGRQWDNYRTRTLSSNNSGMDQESGSTDQGSSSDDL